MLLPSARICDLLDSDPSKEKDPLVIAPKPDTTQLRHIGGASVDLRLGTWFLAMKARRHHVLDVSDSKEDAVRPFFRPAISAIGTPPRIDLKTERRRASDRLMPAREPTMSAFSYGNFFITIRVKRKRP
jgi:hypothetical protein